MFANSSKSVIFAIALVKGCILPTGLLVTEIHKITVQCYNVHNMSCIMCI